MAAIGLLLIRVHYMHETDTQLENMVETRRTYAEFRTTFGYGGFIHNFKNYVLRGSPAYLRRANEQMHLAKELWAKTEDRIPGFFAEKADITTMLRNYTAALTTANTVPWKRTGALDPLVKVDDLPALRAMKALSTYIASYIRKTSLARHSTENILGLCLEFAAFTLLISLFINYLNRSIRRERAEIMEREQEAQHRVIRLRARKDLLELQQAQAEKLGGFGTWVLNLDTWEVQWSDGVFALHGRSVNAKVPTGPASAKYYSAETRKQMARYIRYAAREKTGFTFNFDLTREDGQKRRIASSGQFANHMGHRYLVGVFRDITNTENVAPAQPAFEVWTAAP
ncbi:hypothetical protein [Kordiimonas marina]|uniref:hypothetical protein n=1 Tax=Kordiimonas marina TaxID=2872312 RepID=UPI001FF0F626|nr:hypothetical protein [Kordiimonas marina]MCJ9429596.1 hypothetical protein [Kordiimonas marina]